MAHDLVDEVYRLFINRVDCYLGWHDHWVLKRSTVTKPLIEAALSGQGHLGVQAVSRSGTSRWTCLDVDDDHQIGLLAELATEIPSEHRLFERSRRGGHLWVFHQLIHWEIAHEYGMSLARSVGLDDIEVYPKHGGLQAVRLPGTKHPKTGRVYPVIDPDTGEVLELTSALASIEKLTLSKRRDAPSRDRQAKSNSFGQTTFDSLIAELEPLTKLTIYAPGKASGKCPWHDDTHPSLYVKGKRFHCLACGSWGDVADVRRYVSKGIAPPTH